MYIFTRLMIKKVKNNHEGNLSSIKKFNKIPLHLWVRLLLVDQKWPQDKYFVMTLNVCY